MEKYCQLNIHCYFGLPIYLGKNGKPAHGPDGWYVYTSTANPDWVAVARDVSLEKAIDKIRCIITKDEPS